LSFILVVSGSCSEQSLEAPTKLERLTSNFIKSEKFKSLDINAEELDLKNITLTLTKQGLEMIAIKVVNESSPSWVICSFSNNELPYYAFRLNVSSNTPLSEMKEAFDAKKFHGSISLSTASYSISFNFKNSVLLKTDNAESGKTSKCSSLRDAFNCAGSDFEDMGPFSTAACILEFPICMAVLIADCAVRGCDR